MNQSDNQKNKSNEGSKSVSEREKSQNQQQDSNSQNYEKDRDPGRDQDSGAHRDDRSGEEIKRRTSAEEDQEEGNKPWKGNLEYKDPAKPQTEAERRTKE